MLALVSMVAVSFLTALLVTFSGDLLSRTLPGGSVLKVVKISTTNAHSYSFPKVKSWQRFLVGHLPASFTAGLDWWGPGGRPASVQTIPPEMFDPTSGPPTVSI